MIWFLVFTLVLVGASMIFLPEQSRKTVPLGVSVPTDRVNDAAVVSSIRGYRLTCVSLTVLSVVGSVLTRKT